MNQQEIIEVLLEFGFKQPYSHFPEKLEFEGYSFKVRKNDSLADIFKRVFKAGQQLKVWEIKRVLEVV